MFFNNKFFLFIFCLIWSNKNFCSQDDFHLGKRRAYSCEPLFEETLNCPVCGLDFLFEESLASHISFWHESLEQSSGDVMKLFIHDDNDGSHQISELFDDSEQVSLQEQQLMTVMSNPSNQDVTRYEDSLPYKCSFCSFVFDFSCVRTSHENRCEKRKGKLVRRCSFCNEWFKDFYARRTHEREEHNR
ncbi:MAG: hypothetical protein UR26_C0001G0088 [candidate division TM6 bacterium GW2011_GWF2_32_72]|nr:MAG: hypothetical protein UR26_C0001G0088 [candidate division TM6 bacterium GW2011_GWF2_32_72]